MARGRLATLFQRSVPAYLSARRLPPRHARILQGIADCRTPAAGGHTNVCDVCGHEEHGCNSCRNRHCPTCQAPRQEDWIDDRLERMLPTQHFHVVFTLPDELREFAAYNPDRVYDRLLKAAAHTLLQLCNDRLGLRPGITLVLHTWTREMLRHPHVHCVVSAGGQDTTTGGWKEIPTNYLLPVDVMTDLFRGTFLAMLRAIHADEPLQLPDGTSLRDLLGPLHRKRWVVNVKPALRRPTRSVIAYLAAYIRRVAISESRVTRLDDHSITFRTRGTNSVTLTDEEFLDRFGLHILPHGFRKVRHYGLYAPGNARRFDTVRTACVLALQGAAQATKRPPRPDRTRRCPVCNRGTLRFSVYLPAHHPFLDSS